MTVIDISRRTIRMSFLFSLFLFSRGLDCDSENYSDVRKGKGFSTVYKKRDKFLPRKHHADYRDRGNWGTTKTRNINVVVHGFNSGLARLATSVTPCPNVYVMST